MCLLAGGRSKFVCIYNVRHQVLLKKFQISRNLAFDGMMVRVSRPEFHTGCVLTGAYKSFIQAMKKKGG